MTERERGGLWFLVQTSLLTCAFTLPVALQLLHRTAQWSSTLIWQSRVAGAALFMGSTVLFIASKRALGPYLTPHPLPARGAPLRRDGVYARVRHPMYLAIVSGTTAWTLMWANVPCLALAGACVIFFWFKARYEEQLLRGVFPNYADYSLAVPRMLPRLKRREGRVP